jgi:hypothetical protein
MNKCSNGTTKYSRKDMRSGLCKKDKIQCCLEHLDLLLTTLRFIFSFCIDHMCFHGDCIKFSVYFLILFLLKKNQSVAYELGFRNTLSSGFAKVSYEYCSRETNVMAHELAKFTFQSSSSYLG